MNRPCFYKYVIQQSSSYRYVGAIEFTTSKREDMAEIVSNTIEEFGKQIGEDLKVKHVRE
jgi:hypothetical protein